MDRARPRKLHCPHCGEFNAITYFERTVGHIVKDTRTVKGRGVYAGFDYRKDDVIEVSPVIIITGNYDTLPMPIPCLIYDWEGPFDVVTSALALGYGSLFNHANPANMRFDMNYKDRTIIYFAAQDIRAGEELTINYNTADGAPVSTQDTWFEEMNIKPI